MAKRPFIRKQKRKRHGATFWDHEYKVGGLPASESRQAGNLKLSTEVSGDLEKFTRWRNRQKNLTPLSGEMKALDVGCGNGRNLIFLAREFNLSGTGYDSSSAAIAEAKKLSRDLPIVYETRSMVGELSLPDQSQDLVLDMMSSHFLNEPERHTLRDEIHRVLKPGGWLFMKTFLLDGDLHTKRLLEERPGTEAGTYIHPVIGVPEYVYSEQELVEFLEEKFIVQKTYRSHKHISHGKARKRRTISVYAEKDPYLPEPKSRPARAERAGGQTGQ